jgi:outer membrane protein OmpA-like peptidoglycan-associated protein
MADAMLSAEFEDYRFLLVGHTDARGAADYNLDLSYRRAGGLRQWLIERFGFRAERIAAEGRGEEEPVASGNSQADHARNRRVELRLLD